MKPVYFLLSILISLSSFSQKPKGNERLQPVSSFEITGTVSENQPKMCADMVGSFDYLRDKDGYDYGAVFYLYNPNDYEVSVVWLFAGSVNVSFGPASSDRTIIPAKSKLWITTCTVIDKNKAWDSGMLKWKY